MNLRFRIVWWTNAKGVSVATIIVGKWALIAGGIVSSIACYGLVCVCLSLCVSVWSYGWLEETNRIATVAAVAGDAPQDWTGFSCFHARPSPSCSLNYLPHESTSFIRILLLFSISAYLSSARFIQLVLFLVSCQCRKINLRSANECSQFISDGGETQSLRSSFSFLAICLVSFYWIRCISSPTSLPPHSSFFFLPFLWVAFCIHRLFYNIVQCSILANVTDFCRWST